MKGVYGLVIAITLGIAAAIFNFVYLSMKSRDVERVYFVGIGPETTVAPGERLHESHLVKVGVPERWVGNLDDFGIRDKDRSTVIDQRVWRMLKGGSLLLRDDLKTPPPALELNEDEGAIGIPVDSRAYPITLVDPGDQVSFLVSKWLANTPIPAVRPNPDDPQPIDDPSGPGVSSAPQTPGATETIGPFTVLSLGNRLGTTEVMKANRIPQFQGNVMTIRVKVGKDYKLADPKAQKLVDLLHATSFRQVGILHLPQGRKSK